MHSKMSARGASCAVSFAFALAGIASAAPEAQQAVQISESTLLDLIDADLVDALGVDDQSRFVAFVGLSGDSGGSAFVASVPRTVNGTDIDNEDATDSSGGGEVTPPPIKPPVAAPATPPDESWWRRVVRWIWN